MELKKTVKMELILRGDSATDITRTGKVVLTNEEATKSKESTILFKHHTVPDDLEAISKSEGIVTIVGGTLSHAPILAREFKKACLINCSDLKINLQKNELMIKDRIIPAGTMVTVDGMTGSVFLR